MTNHSAPEIPTTDLFMGTVVTRIACPKHKAALGDPCWSIERGFSYFGAICNKRARRAGFNHRISEKSLHMNRTFKKR